MGMGVVNVCACLFVCGLDMLTLPIAVVSIVLATLITVGDVSVHRPMTGVVELVARNKFTRAFLAVSNISAAYGE
jgi:hypothetical protein